ncbi:hypothetical protein RJ639_016169 [Escallonia herrerae]|uniref:Chromatin assembly factor 1 subunit FAS1 n=1 Tax=Escallonia herrerae TaxID=1293975 RepID=A0AA88VEE7_9ASTE|nr:hypothetical protein RJ639_016169 [Escallonia herrerae]
MADVIVVDADESEPKQSEMNGPDQSTKKSRKRKRASSFTLTREEREARIDELKRELDGLFKYYTEIRKPVGLDHVFECVSSNSVIACLLEESSLPLSKLVDEIYEKVKERDGFGSVTVASVKSSVLLIGQRLFYGLPNADADVLEDECGLSLWCWETRDVKLMPKSIRGALKIWRTCRKKIQERIVAVSAMITALEKSENDQDCKQEQMKASARLGKVLSEADIRLLVESMVQKNNADMAEKDVRREEKLLVKQLERNKQVVEKERKRMDMELQKEKLQSEKELKRLQDEADKEGRRREKEDSEMRKQLRRQQEEAEKNQRRREKEEAESKKQFALQKQASLMERFLKRSKNSSTSQNNYSPTKVAVFVSPPKRDDKILGSVALSMDSALSQAVEFNADDIWKLHLNSWHCLGHSIRSNRNQNWGIRRKPKTELVKELKLTTNRGLPRDDEVNLEKVVDGWGETNSDSRLCHTSKCGSAPRDRKCTRSKQLLQFDKSNRPAFYGLWPRKRTGKLGVYCFTSNFAFLKVEDIDFNQPNRVVGARHPFVKDPDLDYEIDSDEEWEEEEPGENLSDCDKDDEEESIEEGCSKVDEEDESEDGFFVPDGYLSENEGVQVDKMECDQLVEEARSSPSCKEEVESEEFSVLLRQHKYLHNLTELALRKNRPLIILNLMQNKAPMLLAEDLSGTPEFELKCLLALSMRAFPGGPSIEISVSNNVQEEAQELCSSSSKGSATPVSTAAAILNSDLPQIVSIIHSCSQSINKVVESLQQKFPDTPKSVLRNKVREVSDFADNRWQVKREILNKLGLSTSPEKINGTTKSLATFFSKRCLPPSGKAINLNEASPQKAASAVQVQLNHPHNNQ